MSDAPRVPPALYPFEGHYCDCGGHRLHYLDEGSGEPLVLVHGNPTWSFYYRDLVRALRDDYRLLVPDHIGCGLSDKPDDAHYRYTLDQRVADFTRFLEQLELSEPLTLVAHDWGGMIAMAWAVRHPERVGRLVLMNTAAFHLPDDMRMPATLAFVRNTRLAALCVRHLNLFSRGAAWMAPAKRLPKPVRDAYCAPYDTPDHRIATLRFVQDIPLAPGDPAYDTVSEVEKGLSQFHDTPVLLLWGEKDFVFKPEVCSVFEKIWPQAEVQRFPEAGHYVLEDAATEIPPRLRDFLARHPL
ncbi:MAG: alpha/beta fold hydrolase [Myxococcota bacterium]|nr:alpha/beta fold hydrolase [Myxococcota bacterium]